ncbi:MAG: tol-pal system protein YbgF [Pseudomonadota bacterium]
MLLHIRRVRREVILGLVLLSIFALSGCLYLQPRKAADMDSVKEDMTRIERSCAENDKKVAEIYSHLYILQAKVYSNENQINALKTQLTPQTPPEKPEPETPALHRSDEAGGRDSQLVTRNSQPEPTKEAAPPKPSAVTTPVELSPSDAYKSAYAAYQKGLYEEAIALFNGFVEKYPEHDLADNSQYWIGECYYAIKDYQSALQAFKKVIEKYPDGNKMPDALLKTGYSSLALKDYQNARVYLARVVKDYPFSTAAQNAEIKLKKIEVIGE